MANPRPQQQTFNPPQGSSVPAVRGAAGALTIRDEQIDALQAVAAQYDLAALNQLDHFRRTFRIAQGIQALTEAMTDDVLGAISPLMNSPLGFRTDHAPANFAPDGKAVQPYGLGVLRVCVVEALLRGLRLTGNEFN